MNRAEFEKQFKSALKGRFVPDEVIEDITAPLPKSNFLLHFDLLEELENDYSGEEIKTLVYAWKDYVESGIIPELKDRGLRQAWQRGRDQIDRDSMAYMRATIRNRIITYFRNRQSDNTTGDQSLPLVTSGNRYKDYIGINNDISEINNDISGIGKDATHKPDQTETQDDFTIENIRAYFQQKHFRSDPDGFYENKKKWKSAGMYWKEWAEDWEQNYRPKAVKTDLSFKMKHNRSDEEMKQLALRAKNGEADPLPVPR